MTINDFINKAWNDHAADAQGVAASLSEGLSLLTENSQIPAFVALAAHVLGEHLGQWNEGIEFLNGLKKLNVFQENTESHFAIDRSVASLALAGNLNKDLHKFSNADQIRIYASAAAALCGQNQVDRASEYFKKALDMAPANPDKADPAARTLAITGNNLAATFEEKETRSPEENQLMILAAKTGRKFWEVVGTWLHVERAECRLSMTYLKAGQPQQALQHAQLCLEVVEQNKAEPMEYFFAYEALALSEKASGNCEGFNKAVQLAKENLERIQNDGDKSYCQKTLEKMNPLN